MFLISRISTLALIYLFIGCSQLSKENNYSSRFPAAKSQGCFSGLNYILLKRQRGKTIKELVKGGGLTDFKDLFWQGHLAERATKKIPDGRFYRKFRRLNQSFHVPALFQEKNGFTGEVDTFSTIVKVVDNHVDIRPDELEAIDDVKGWINYVKDYKNRMELILDTGFEQRRQLQKLRERVQKLNKEEFPLEVKVPIVNKKGQADESVIEFESKDDLVDFIEDTRREVKLTFSQNYVDEFFKKGRLYKGMLDQAIYVRRLELALERLKNIPNAKLDKAQMELKALIQEVLKEPSNQARGDVMRAVRRKEMWAEFWASLRFWKSERVVKEAKYEVPSVVMEQAKALSPAGVMIRSAAILTIASTAIGTPLSVIYNDNPWIQYIQSSIVNRYNDFIVFTLGLPSADLSACYKSTRAFALEDTSTMNDFVESHLSRYTALSRIDSSKTPEDYEVYNRRKLKLQALCSKMRLEYGSAARHVRNKELANEHGYRFAAHLLFVELVEQHHPKGKKLASLLYEYFEQKEFIENDLRAQKTFNKITSIAGKKFARDLEEYQINIAKAVPFIRSGEFNVYYPSTEEFLEKLRTLPSD